MIQSIVEGFLNAYFEHARRTNQLRRPGKIPIEMLDESIPESEGWFGWKPIPSQVTDSELNLLETVIGLKYPPPYRQLLKAVHYMEIDFGPVRFEPHPVGTWQDRLKKLYKAYCPKRILGTGLIPFGSEGMWDAGLICFDSKHTDGDGDCPVVCWNHEFVGKEKEVFPLFSSSLRMFKCLTVAGRSDSNFAYFHAESDIDADSEQGMENTHDDLAAKQEIMREFLGLDPEGAGGVARKYWTQYVDPK